MSGQAQINVQPSNLGGTTLTANVWRRGIPTPGALTIGAVQGIPDCKNLIASSPPTLLERYDVFSYAIGWGAYLTDLADFASAPEVNVELAILVNDQVRYVETQQQQPTILAGGGQFAVATGAFVGDLVNQIRVGARERLGLRIGLLSSIDVPNIADLFIGIQLDNQGDPVAYESTISYNVADLPASRRL